MSLVHGIVDNPVKVAVGVLLVALFGTIGLYEMPMQLTPEVQTPTLTIETRWPGASPQEVEREIVGEQEEQLNSVEGMIQMTSESMDSVGRIILRFDTGTDMEEALLKVNTRLQQVREYPVDAQEPTISTSSSNDRPIAWFILSQRVPSPGEIAAFQAAHPDLAAALEPARKASGGGLRAKRLQEAAKVHPEVAPLLPPEIDVQQLRTFAEDFIESRFERVPGVSGSSVIGGREEELQVVVDPEKLAARALTIADVRQALRSENQDTSGGDFWEGKRRYVVRTLGQFRKLSDVESVVLAYREGGPIYVRDVAQVRMGWKKSAGTVRSFGQDAIAINCLRQTGSNVLDVMDGLREATAELNGGVLPTRGLQLTNVYDETEYIHSSVGLVKDNILIGGILTVAILLLFLRSARSTLVIALAIPTSIVGTFLILWLLGRTLNVISLAGLSFAVGMLVDNAIVVLENIFRLHQEGLSRREASIQGTSEVWGAVVASTLTTLAVFLPVLFVQEEAGQLFRDIAIAISGAVGLSLVVSVTVIPPATARILPRRTAHPHGPVVRAIAAPFVAIGRVLHVVFLPFELLGRGFVASVVWMNAWLLRGIVRRLVAVGLLVWIPIELSQRMIPKVEYLPTGNRNLVIAIVLPPPGYNVEQLAATGAEIEERLRPLWDVDPDSPEMAGKPVIGDFFCVVFGRLLFIGVRAADPKMAGALVPEVQKGIMGLPGTFGFASQTSLFEQGITGGRQIEIQVSGPELPRLIQIAGGILVQSTGVVPGTHPIPKPSLDLSSPEVHVTPKPEIAADMGIVASDLGYTVNALVDGAYATDYYVGDHKIDLSILGGERWVARTQDLEELPIATPRGNLVPLSAVADVTMSSGPEQINHRERQRTITIEVKVPPEIAVEQAMEDIEREIVGPLEKGGQLGTEYRIDLGGTADKLRQTWNALRFNFLLALLITYLLMAALFESWLYPLVIILSVPLGAVGGLGALKLLNLYLASNHIAPQPLDVLTMLGFVILIGTVVNNPILIVHQSINHMKVDRMEPAAAILESTRTRIRPIFMTTTTTVFGLLPLVLFPGAGSELYRGLGAVVLGGLVVSTVFTLVLVPILFSLVMGARMWVVHVLGLDRE